MSSTATTTPRPPGAWSAIRLAHAPGASTPKVPTKFHCSCRHPPGTPAEAGVVGEGLAGARRCALPPGGGGAALPARGPRAVRGAGPPARVRGGSGACERARPRRGRGSRAPPTPPRVCGAGGRGAGRRTRAGRASARRCGASSLRIGGAHRAGCGGAPFSLRCGCPARARGAGRRERRPGRQRTRRGRTDHHIPGAAGAGQRWGCRCALVWIAGPPGGRPGAAAVGRGCEADASGAAAPSASAAQTGPSARRRRWCAVRGAGGVGAGRRDIGLVMMMPRFPTGPHPRRWAPPSGAGARERPLLSA